MYSLLLLINAALKVIVWGMLVLFGAGVMIVVITTISIAYAISAQVGMATLALFLGLIYVMFYWPNS